MNTSEHLRTLILFTTVTIMVNPNKKAGLGRALHRSNKAIGFGSKSDRHTTELANQNPESNLRSLTAQSTVDEFFEIAELAGKQFIAEKRDISLIKNEQEKYHHEAAPIDREQFKSILCVPRRPKWDSTTTPEQLCELEKKHFLEWRKKLAMLQENSNVMMTPFEKNLELWRQLWRVVERSDLVVQIVDSRNPLMYYCEDLVNYVREHKTKLNAILLNKADFLNDQQRRYWSDYFEKRSIKAIFFSALQQKEALKESDTNSRSSDDIKIKLYDKKELLELWKQMAIEQKNKIIQEDPEEEHTCVTVGLVGYPNVGKSSTINALLSAKKTGVSATPGKTKHFQTFIIDETLTLCDCPGLVFPNLVIGKADMLVNGVLPIDQMKDHMTAIDVLVSQIPRHVFEDIYGLAFEQSASQEVSSDDLLNSYGFMRGYMTQRGLPDVARAARRILKDYVKGKLLYCHAPPGVDQKEFHQFFVPDRVNDLSDNLSSALRMTERQGRLMAQASGKFANRDFNIEFKPPNVHYKGLPGIGNMTKPLGTITDMPHANKKHKKKEKLRRVYRHLDI